MSEQDESASETKVTSDVRNQLLAVRVEPEIAKRIDGLREYYSTSGRKVTRSKVIRALLLEALPGMERRAERERQAKE